MINGKLSDNTVHFTHPVTGMIYRKMDMEGDYYFKSNWQNKPFGGWVKSGMKSGFIPLK